LSDEPNEQKEVESDYDIADAEVPFAVREINTGTQESNSHHGTHSSKGFTYPFQHWMSNSVSSLRNKIPKQSTFWTALATIVMAFVTAMYTLYARRQWKAISDEIPEVRKSADAAKSAADTAREALHVSERAYIVDAAPELGVKSITLSFVNTGHIPSGKVSIEAHEATINAATNAATPAATLDLRDAVERHWGAYKVQSIFPGTNSLKLAIPVPQLSEDRLNVGLQQIVVAGYLVYSDGFPETPQQTLGFCQHTVYQTVIKHMFITPCDPQEMIPRLAALDGYPNNPEP
jgi:hypothetical protein